MNQPARASNAPNPSRRDFLQQASLATAALTGALAVPRSAHAGVDETIKLALVGCGSRGSGALANALQASPHAKLWAMADAFGDRLEKSHKALAAGAQQQTGDVPPITGRTDVPPERRFVGLDAYKAAIDAADVVLLCGPPGFRPDHFEYAVERGKHVFMEKPVATDGPGIRRVLRAAEEAKKKSLKVGVGLQRHHDPRYLETLRRVADGAIGDVRMMRCYWNGGTVKQPYPRAGLSELEFQVRNWYFFCWLSGDHIVEQHVHNLDVCNWIMGQHPISAAGMGGRQMRVGKDYGDIFDHHAVEFTYPNGVKMFSQCRQIPGCEMHVDECVAGTNGDADFGKFSIVTGLPGSTQKEWKYPREAPGSKAANPYQLEHDALFAAIANNTPHNEAERGAIATMTAILGRMATYTGQTVTWDAGFNSQRLLGPDSLAGWQTTPRTLPDAAGLYSLPQPGLIKDV